MRYTRLSTNQIGDSFALLNESTVQYRFYNDRDEHEHRKELSEGNLNVSTILVDPFGKYVLLYGLDRVYIFNIYRKSAGYPCLFYQHTLCVE